VLVTDGEEEALDMVRRNAHENGLAVDTALCEWGAADQLVEQAPFDLVLAADVLYERASVALLLELLPRLGAEALLADPGRPAAEDFLAGARRRGWEVASSCHGDVQIHHLRTGGSSP
jgi:predicted nicotinamide N-methyase